ncbi:MAG: response regulator [Acidobacteria bacterium]|nr:response regulator [Acidobacteriota bacterium]
MAETGFRVLIVDHEDESASRFRQALTDLAEEVVAANSCREALDRMDVAVIVTEREPPEGTWKELLKAAQRRTQPPNLIVTCDAVQPVLWADVLKSGGFDVLPKDATDQSIQLTVCGAFRRWQRSAAKQQERARSASAWLAGKHQGYRAG